MLFRKKKQDSDVVDVANHTLEQDELKYMTGSGRSYAVVLTVEKKNDIRCSRRRKGRVAKGPLLDSRRESTHDDCRLTRREFGKTRISQCARNRELTLEKHLGNQGVSAGGMLAPYRH